MMLYIRRKDGLTTTVILSPPYEYAHEQFMKYRKVGWIEATTYPVQGTWFPTNSPVTFEIIEFLSAQQYLSQIEGEIP
jgi:hypothetical protein